MPTWQDRSSFFLDGVEFAGIESQRLKDGGSYLGGFDEAGHRTRCETRIRKQHDHVGIVVRKAAVLLLFFCRFPCPGPRSIKRASRK